MHTLALQTDGKILAGGEFLKMVGQSRRHIARLNATGTLDASFNPGAESAVYALAVQPDGKILAGGDCVGLGGGTGATSRLRLGRLTNTGAAFQRLVVTGAGSRIRWWRSGAGPEVWRVTFESSSDGVIYTSLGSGTRITGGWQLSGRSLPINQSRYVRARGYYGTGRGNGSGSIVESVLAAFPSPFQPFTDNALKTGASVIRAVHITELRARIDVVRLRFGLAAYAYPGAAITAGTTVVQPPHITDLRTALSQAYAASGQTAPLYTDPALSAGMTIKVAHIAELRAAVRAIE